MWHRIYQSPNHRDWLIPGPGHEFRLTAVIEGSAATVRELRFSANEKVNRDPLRRVCLNGPARVADLTSSILALPLKLIGRKEMILVLKRFGVIRLIQRDKKEGVLSLPNKALPPIPF